MNKQKNEFLKFFKIDIIKNGYTNQKVSNTNQKNRIF